MASVTFAAGIVAHVDRTHRIPELIESLNGLITPPNVSVDDGTLGIYGNHRKVLVGLAGSSASHALVLEDDARPCAGFIEILNGHVTEKPDDLLGLYVGRRKPGDVQSSIAEAIRVADAMRATWLGLWQPLHRRSLRWGVGYVIPTADIPAAVARADELHQWGADRRIGRWHAERGRLSYPWPSLVDHLDEPSTRGLRTAGRVAWRTHPMPE